MQQIYQAVPADGFHWIHPVDKPARRMLERLSGAPLFDWDPPVVRFEPSSDRSPWSDAIPDAPWQGESLMVFRETAHRDVHHLFDQWGQFLELRVEHSTERLFAFNATTVIDCLDEPKSDLAYYPDGIRVILANRWAFDGSKIPEGSIFRVPKLRTLLFTREKKRSIEALELTGAKFKLLWSSAG